MSHIKYYHAKVHLFNFEEIFFISLNVCLINFMCNVSCNLLQKRKQFPLWESTATSFSTNQANVFASHRYSWSKVSGTGFRIEIYPCFHYLCIYHSGHRQFSVAEHHKLDAQLLTFIQIYTLFIQTFCPHFKLLSIKNLWLLVHKHLPCNCMPK